MGVTGDFQELARFRKQLEGFSDAVPRIAREVAPEIQVLIADAVSGGKDPFGGRLEPRQDGGIAFASLAGTVAGPAKVTASGTSVFARVTRKIPRFMNRGRKSTARHGYMPARPIVPTEGDAVPPTWVAVLEESAAKVMDVKGRP